MSGLPVGGEGDDAVGQPFLAAGEPLPRLLEADVGAVPAVDDVIERGADLADLLEDGCRFAPLALDLRRGRDRAGGGDEAEGRRGGSGEDLEPVSVHASDGNASGRA